MNNVKAISLFTTMTD